MAGKKLKVIELFAGVGGFILENNILIKQKLSSGLMLRYPDFNYEELVDIDDKIFTTNIRSFIKNFFVDSNLYIKNKFKDSYVNLVGGLAGNIDNPKYFIKRLNISNW